MTRDEQLQQVWTALGAVTDPELDESVTALEFITAVQIDNTGHVRIEFQLPTYWCSANFAFLMATDMRDAVAALSWAHGVEVVLLDHFCSDQVNQSVAQGTEFREAFAEEADANLEDLRLRFLRKAFERRQELILRDMLNEQFEPVQLAVMDFAQLMQLSLKPAVQSHRDLYAVMYRKLDVDRDRTCFAFLTVDGQPLQAATLNQYLRHLAGVRRNTEFNSHLCRGLLEARRRGAGTPQAPRSEQSKGYHLPVI